MQRMAFIKMNGAGNDFVMIDNRAGGASLDAAAIARVCDRHRGIGADGLLAVETTEKPGADFRMRYYNADGGEAEMCGNGARCFARFARWIADYSSDSLRFETAAGIIGADFEGERVRISMSLPRDIRLAQPVEAAGSRLTVHSIDTGVPHAVIFVDRVDDVDVAGLGAALRHHPQFAPRGTNVNFVSVESPRRLRLRTFERGVEAETLACGTGATASALIYSATRATPGPVYVAVRGGDELEVGYSRLGSGFANVTLTGPADFVFSGEIEL